MKNYNYYYKIDCDFIKEKNINASDKLVFMIIYNLSKKEGYCYASNEKISELTGLTDRTVRNSLKVLTTCDYITKWKQKKGKKVYRFLTPKSLLNNQNLKEVIEKTKELKPNESFYELYDYDWLNSSEEE